MFGVIARTMYFYLLCVIWWFSVVCVRVAGGGRLGTVPSVPAWFRADSGTNLIKQEKIVSGRPCGSTVGAHAVCGRSWVRVPVGRSTFSSPVT